MVIKTGINLSNERMSKAIEDGVITDDEYKVMSNEYLELLKLIDDYKNKPIDMKELVSQVEANVMRRMGEIRQV